MVCRDCRYRGKTGYDVGARHDHQHNLCHILESAKKVFGDLDDICNVMDTDCPHYFAQHLDDGSGACKYLKICELTKDDKPPIKDPME